MTLRQTLMGQFKMPHGYLGRVAGWIMALRKSNRERNFWTADLMDIRPGDKVLELGCGPGVALTALLANVGNGQVVGSDPSQIMLKQARARNSKAVRQKRLDLQLGTLDDLPKSVGSYDKICSVNVVQFLPDRTAAFAKIFAMLKPKGVAATTYMPRDKNPSRANALSMADEVKQLLETTGFVNIRVEELAMEPVPAICVIGEHP